LENIAKKWLFKPFCGTFGKECATLICRAVLFK